MKTGLILVAVLSFASFALANSESDSANLKSVKAKILDVTTNIMRVNASTNSTTGCDTHFCSIAGFRDTGSNEPQQDEGTTLDMEAVYAALEAIDKVTEDDKKPSDDTEKPEQKLLN